MQLVQLTQLIQLQVQLTISSCNSNSSIKLTESSSSNHTISSLTSIIPAILIHAYFG